MPFPIGLTSLHQRAVASSLSSRLFKLAISKANDERSFFSLSHRRNTAESDRRASPDLRKCVISGSVSWWGCFFAVLLRYKIVWATRGL